MLGVVATIKVKPGMEKEFEAVAKELVAKVNANEIAFRRMNPLCSGSLLMRFNVSKSDLMQHDGFAIAQNHRW